jgi:hypothetical protein
VVAFAVVVSVDPRTPPRAREIWWVAVHQFISRKTLGREELNCITFDIRSEQWEKVPPAPNDRRISVDSDAHSRRFLVEKDRTASQVRLDIGGVGRKDVDDVLIALALASRIPHGTIIVISGDDVKRFWKCEKTDERTEPLSGLARRVRGPFGEV